MKELHETKEVPFYLVFAVQVEAYRRNNLEMPSLESHRIFRLSPIVSGLMLFYFRYQYRGAGLAVANAWGSIQYCEYLYGILHREKPLRDTWLDMVVLRTCVEEESIYGNTDLVSKEGPRVLDGPPVSSMFKVRYVDNSSEVEVTPKFVHRIVE
ncbi:hypothetical protein GGR52DRAFT_141741 [Hypoxylon sp. FL1284]|nr:hypothetical protein GGR52DRAFT_141741 [Hypoxylon sp. FL1284]